MRDLTVKETKELYNKNLIFIEEYCWYTELINQFGQDVFNNDAALVSDKPLPNKGSVFFRSNSPFKEPAGKIISSRKAQRLAQVRGPETVVWASQKAIEKEIRVYWCLAMGYQHKAYVAVPKRSFGAPIQVEHPSLDFLKQFQLPFVFDFVLNNGKLSILEMNVPEASGLYGDFEWPDIC